MPQLPRRVAIRGGTRIPFARANSAYAEASNQDMLTAVFKALVDRFDLRNQALGEVAAGGGIKASGAWNLAGETPPGSGLHPETPAYDLQRACGTSLSAIIQLGYRIALGEIECAIGGGVDSASDVPLAYSKPMRNIFLKAFKARTLGEKLRAWSDFKFKYLAPMPPSTGEPRTGLSMGQHCEEMAKEWGISRVDQDALAFASHQNAAAAWKAGFFSDLIVPFKGLEKDNNVRGDTSLERLAQLKTAFDRSAQGTLTAGDNSPLTDRAAGGARRPAGTGPTS